MTKFYALCVGLLLSWQLSLLPPGPVVAVAASNCVPYLFTRRQIVYISDATFRSASKIYPEMRALPVWLSRQCDDNEARALRNADFIILPSKWAIDSAIADYGIQPNKLFMLSFGANIDGQLVKQFGKSKTIEKENVNFLFASADWKRKGGDKAIEICRALRDRSIGATLIILGAAPDYVRAIDFIQYKGFLKKSDPAELEEICRAYRDAHFLLLPTLADASPIVFAEAQAFGTPPITHDVGGTGSSIIDGVTGLMLNIDCTPDQASERIIPYCNDPALYQTLSVQSQEWFAAHAQWSNWSDLIFKLCKLDQPSPKV
ncbi:glycosyltransferase family 4 protein [Bradyrhizobium sp. USDA 4463]